MKIKSIVTGSLAIALSAVMGLNSASFAGQLVPDNLDKTSKSTVLVDFDTNRIIYAKNPDEKRSIASMSKIMTLYVTLDLVKQGKIGFNDKITITQQDTKIIGSNMKLRPGQVVTLDDLVKGMMVISANDAAMAIARHGGNGSVVDFVNMMNKKAEKLGMKNTKFYNPNGLPILKNEYRQMVKEDEDKKLELKKQAESRKNQEKKGPISSKIKNSKEMTPEDKEEARERANEEAYKKAEKEAEFNRKAMEAENAAKEKAKKNSTEVNKYFENHSTAKEMSTLAINLFKDYKDEVVKITSIKKFKEGYMPNLVYSTNPLMDRFTKVDGLKTGYTDSAGYCLTFTSPIGRNSHAQVANRIFGITMGNPTSDDRKANASNLLEYVYKNFETELLYKKNYNIDSFTLNGIEGMKIPVATKNDVYVFKKSGEDIEKEIKLDNVKRLEKGDKVGVLQLKDDDGKIVSKYDLFAQKSPKDFPFSKRVNYFFTSFKNSFSKDKNDKSIINSLF